MLIFFDSGEIKIGVQMFFVSTKILIYHNMLLSNAQKLIPSSSQLCIQNKYYARELTVVLEYMIAY